ncbi:MAG: flagellar assembly peptidoglycan hydrolase FlgJ [Pontibacterium sp.]
MAIKPPNNVENSALFTELNSLAKIKETAKTDQQAALRNVAEQFEQMFMSMLLKSMRQANESFGENNPLNSSETKFYEGMLDQQMTMEIAQQGGMGLADMLVKQLSQQYGTQEGTSTPNIKGLDEKETQQLLLDKALNSLPVDEAKRVSEFLSMDSAYLRPTIPSALKPSVDSAQSVGSVEQVNPVVTERLPATFTSPEAFVQELMPYAEQAAASIGVDPKILIAQAALETGWGKFTLKSDQGDGSYNLFNIKADQRWDGSSVNTSTLEYRDGIAVREQASFRVYGSYQESFNDYVAFLQNNARYQDALKATNDPEAFIQALQDAGYATDPAYAQKITTIFNGDWVAGAQVTNNRG